jgi:single-strand DNA-binding protein
MNETVITVCGRVVADPEHRSTRAGTQFTTFRVASTVRRRNREGVFVDGPTSFYNVAAYRSVGMNSHTSLRKGDPVVVYGRLTINTWQRVDESWGSSPEVEAITVGHDLTFGTTEYAKAGRGAADAAAQEASQHGYAMMTDRLESGEGQRWGAPVDAPSGEAAGDDMGEDVDATERQAPVTVPA